MAAGEMATGEVSGAQSTQKTVPLSVEDAAVSMPSEEAPAPPAEESAVSAMEDPPGETAGPAVEEAVAPCAEDEAAASPGETAPPSTEEADASPVKESLVSTGKDVVAPIEETAASVADGDATASPVGELNAQSASDVAAPPLEEAVATLEEIVAPMTKEATTLPVEEKDVPVAEEVAKPVEEGAAQAAPEVDAASPVEETNAQATSDAAASPLDEAAATSDEAVAPLTKEAAALPVEEKAVPVAEEVAMPVEEVAGQAAEEVDAASPLEETLPADEAAAPSAEQDAAQILEKATAPSQAEETETPPAEEAPVPSPAEAAILPAEVSVEPAAEESVASPKEVVHASSEEASMVLPADDVNVSVVQEATAAEVEEEPSSLASMELDVTIRCPHGDVLPEVEAAKPEEGLQASEAPKNANGDDPFLISEAEVADTPQEILKELPEVKTEHAIGEAEEERPVVPADGAVPQANDVEATTDERVNELISMGFNLDEARDALARSSSLEEAAAFLVEKHNPPPGLFDTIMGWFKPPSSAMIRPEAYKPGKYKVCGGGTTLRSSPQSSEVLQHLRDGAVVEIVEIAAAEDGHIQGKLADGRWLSIISSQGHTSARWFSVKAQLVELGFSEAKAQEAAKRCSSIEAAVDYLS